jgi:hypothetical protein
MPLSFSFHIVEEYYIMWGHKFHYENRSMTFTTRGTSLDIIEDIITLALAYTQIQMC